jgi:hypothetical protein
MTKNVKEEHVVKAIVSEGKGKVLSIDFDHHYVTPPTVDYKIMSRDLAKSEEEMTSSNLSWYAVSVDCDRVTFDLSCDLCDTQLVAIDISVHGKIASLDDDEMAWLYAGWYDDDDDIEEGEFTPDEDDADNSRAEAEAAIDDAIAAIDIAIDKIDQYKDMINDKEA